METLGTPAHMGGQRRNYIGARDRGAKEEAAQERAAPQSQREHLRDSTFNGGQSCGEVMLEVGRKVPVEFGV